MNRQNFATQQKPELSQAADTSFDFLPTSRYALVELVPDTGRRLMLACTRLEFEHPGSGQRIDVVADPGPEFALLGRGVGWPAAAGAAAADPVPGLSSSSP